MVAWVVSEDDLVRGHPKWGRAPLEKLLWDFGMNTRRPYTEDGRSDIPCGSAEGIDEFDCKHRSQFSGKVIKGIRYVGVARTDGAWYRFVDRFLDLPLV